jgi:hypothetical protein
MHSRQPSTALAAEVSAKAGQPFPHVRDQPSPITHHLSQAFDLKNNARTYLIRNQIDKISIWNQTDRF